MSAILRLLTRTDVIIIPAHESLSMSRVFVGHTFLILITPLYRNQWYKQKRLQCLHNGFELIKYARRIWRILVFQLITIQKYTQNTLTFFSLTIAGTKILFGLCRVISQRKQDIARQNMRSHYTPNASLGLLSEEWRVR